MTIRGFCERLEQLLGLDNEKKQEVDDAHKCRDSVLT